MNAAHDATPVHLAEIVIALQSLLLFIGGATGAFCRAAFSQTQETLSRRTLADTIMGGFMGVLLPVISQILPLPVKITGEWTAYQLMAMAGVIAFIANWATTLAGWKLGIFHHDTKPL
jgi:hypothetical protein